MTELPLRGCKCENCYRASRKRRALALEPEPEPGTVAQLQSTYDALERLAADARARSAGEGAGPEAWHDAARLLGEARRCVLVAGAHARHALYVEERSR